MKRTVASILAIVLFISIIPVQAVTAASVNDKIVLSAKALDSLYMQSVDAEQTLSTSSSGFLRFTLKPGTYGNDRAYFQFSCPDFKLYDYPYMRFEFKSNTPANVIDITLWSNSGESWPSEYPSSSNNEASWKPVVFDLNTVTGGAPVDKGSQNITVRFKAWGSGNKSITSESYFELRYVAFFKTKSEASSYTYNPDDNSFDIPKFEVDPDLISDGYELLDTYNAEFDKRIEEIKSTPTSVTVTGNKYYVSENGSDDNDGLSPEKAWQSIRKVDSFSFSDGDGVFFKRGDIFRAEGVTLTLQSGVTYSAYGSGEKPVLVGSSDASYSYLWEETDAPYVYRYIGECHDVGNIYINGGRYWGVHVKNNGGTSFYSDLVSNGLDEPYYSGGKVYNGYKSLENNLEYTNYNDSLYLFSKDGNPGDVFDSIELTNGMHGVDGTGISDVVFDNIKLVGYGIHGISICDITNVNVQNCVFGWIGGSGTRLGNAVQNWKNADGFIIDNCWSYQIYDCCYTTQYAAGTNDDVYIKNVEFKNNLSEYSNTGHEIWNNQGTDNTRIFYDNVKVHDNYVRNSGYGWSHQRPSKDANFYYGAFESPGHSWKDFDVYGNKFFISYKYGLLSRFISEANAHFNNNTYILGKDKVFAKASSSPSSPGMADAEYSYTPEALAMLMAAGVESNGSFYSVDSGYIPEPFNFKSANDVYSQVDFDDIKNHWAKKYISKVVAQKYFNGISSFEFAPEASMTRAMLFTVLSRFAGEEVQSNKVWYDGALQWAISSGLTDAAHADPDSAATRAEVAVIIKRYYDSIYVLTESEPSEYIDTDLLSTMSLDKYDFDIGELTDAIDFCSSAGLLTGYDDNSFKAGATTTRAQIAAVFVRMEEFEKSAELDKSAAASSKKISITSADELYSILDDSNNLSTKSLKRENGKDYVRFLPKDTHGTVQIDLYQNKLDGVDFYEKKYVKFKYRIKYDGTSKTSPYLDVGLRWPDEQWLDNSDKPYISKQDEWLEATVCYDDFTASRLTSLPFESLDTYFYTFKPWDNKTDLSSDCYFDIAEIVFCDSERTADLYKF